MRAIQATPKNIESIFNEMYVIPEFQRPYSWDNIPCSELFEDIKNFFEDHYDNEEQYYLGNIVLYRDGEKWVVIDGQQRLTTMMLLLSALYSQARTATALQSCLKKKDSLTGELVDELKIESNVIEDDRKELDDVVLRNNDTGDSQIKKNYRSLREMLKSYLSELSAEKVNNFILMILKRVVLLPIECDSVDDALIIFNTLNNRGMPLNDADIFKALLFKNIKNNADKKRLIKRWNVLNTDTDGDIEGLFRQLMHIMRARNKVVSKEIGLRKYFMEQDIFNDWNTVLTSLEKINFLNYFENFSGKAKNLWEILHYLPNEFCLYPVIVFWDKYAEKSDDGWKIPEKNLDKFEDLITDTVKYYYASAVAYNSINTIKTTTYKVCSAIANGESYKEYYFKDYNKIYEQFCIKLKNYEYGRCRWGLVALLAILNEKQDQDKLYELPDWQLEHILPQKGGYNNYNGWTETQYEEKLNTIGNFVLLEKKLNIRASNEFFTKKKCEYKNSSINEAKDLTTLLDWTYEEWSTRNKAKEKELESFFRIV